MPNLPQDKQYVQAAVAKDKLYLIGGQASGRTTSDVYEYDFKTEVWTQKASMKVERYYHSVVEVNGMIYVMGGIGPYGEEDTVEMYNPETDQWNTKAKMPIKIRSFGAASIGNKIYAIGGFGNPESSSLKGGFNTVIEYDITTDRWTSKQAFPVKTYHLGAVRLNDKIYTVGGSSSKDKLYEYDNTIDEWVEKASVPTEIFEGHYTVVADNKIYNFYGENPDVSQGKRVEVYTPEGWVAPVVVSEALMSLTATLVNNDSSLSWTASTGADSYTIKRATVSGGPYTDVATEVTSTTYLDTTVEAGKTYYYVVTAVNSAGESGNSNEVSVTIPVPQQVDEFDGNRAILKVTLVSGLEKEYDMTISGIRNFMEWYIARDAGEGKPFYMIDKKFNEGPFINRFDYIVFDKIQNFEICDYNN